MDLQMPGMNGHTATQEIRRLAISRAKELPIVALTANASRDVEAECLASGMNDYLVKPIKVSALKKVIADIVAKKNINEILNNFVHYKIIIRQTAKKKHLTQKELSA